MDDGFIKLHRSILNWEWYSEINTQVVFIYLLLHANWEESHFRGHTIPKGSLVTGRKKIANDLNISERNVRTAIKHLKSTNEVTIQVTNEFSIVTIVNWEKYQGFENEVTNKVTNEMTNKRPTSDHLKEIKNIRNKEYINKPVQKNVDIYRQYKHSNYDFETLERELNERKS